MTGFVDWYDMAKYWNAVDCAVHVPRTTPKWVETFSLAAVQPQITKKPVIGNTSGSVPYQIGFENMIVPEGDIDALRQKLIEMMNNPNQAREIGMKMYERSHNSFEIRHLNELFYQTIQDIVKGVYDENKIDMASK
ncbi:MAG: glycosyltransferase [Alistipes putredinis]|nr:MAG: glycosyltransferase [Alistipes putredinis]